MNGWPVLGGGGVGHQWPHPSSWPSASLNHPFRVTLTSRGAPAATSAAAHLTAQMSNAQHRLPMKAGETSATINCVFPVLFWTDTAVRGSADIRCGPVAKRVGRHLQHSDLPRDMEARASRTMSSSINASRLYAARPKIKLHTPISHWTIGRSLWLRGAFAVASFRQTYAMFYFHSSCIQFLSEILYWWQESRTIPWVFSSTSQRLLMR